MSHKNPRPFVFGVKFHFFTSLGVYYVHWHVCLIVVVIYIYWFVIVYLSLSGNCSFFLFDCLYGNCNFYFSVSMVTLFLFDCLYGNCPFFLFDCLYGNSIFFYLTVSMVTIFYLTVVIWMFCFRHILHRTRGRRDRMVVGFTTICAYHQQSCELKFH